MILFDFRFVPISFETLLEVCFIDRNKLLNEIKHFYRYRGLTVLFETDLRHNTNPE